MANDAGYVQAEYGVPHTNFERTSVGFTVTYRTVSAATVILSLLAVFPLGIMFLWGAFCVLFAILGPPNNNNPLFAAVIALLAPFPIGFLIYRFTRPTTVIHVDGDSVQVNKLKMKRDDFGNFNIWQKSEVRTTQNARATFVRLGYMLGIRQYPMQGLWSERQANEVASALNRELRRTPRSGETATPESLRTARPTDF